MIGGVPDTPRVQRLALMFTTNGLESTVSPSPAVLVYA